MESSSYQGTYRAGVIGHTGRGGYGHGLDMAFVGLPGVQMIAVADPDETGRQEATARAGAARSYADYREMLEREDLDLVAVGPTILDGHEAMVIAAAQAGVKAIYCEKPLARSLDEADRLLAACDAHGVKIAVAHQNRTFPAGRLAKEAIASGKIGRLRAIRAFGKQDTRGGGLDLLVLGGHMCDLMRFFAGDARWCHARVAVEGRDVTPTDVRPVNGMGLVAGDDVVAQYGFDGGVTGTYESMRAEGGGGSQYFHVEYCGTGGVLACWSSPQSPVYYCRRPFPLPDHPEDWESLPVESMPLVGGKSSLHPGNQTLVRDLLAAVESGRQPLSSGQNARAALEMILAVYASHIHGDRVRLPLEEREQPLARWSGRSLGEQ